VLEIQSQERENKGMGRLLDACATVAANMLLSCRYSGIFCGCPILGILFFLCVYAVNLFCQWKNVFDCFGLYRGDTGFYHSLNVRKRQNLLIYLFIVGLCVLETVTKTKVLPT